MHYTALVLVPEQNRFAVRQVDHHFVTTGLLGDAVELTVVEHVAVLIDLDERGTLVGVGCLERFLHVFAIKVVSAGNETRFGAECNRQRVEWGVNRAHGCGLGHLSHLGCGGVLALGQPVDSVVEQQDVEVDVAAQGMN